MSLTGKPPPEIRIEGENCPRAVVEWYQCSASKDQRHDFDLSLKAKKHLVSLGWIFSYCDKKTRWELRYKSPSGKTYISLRTACKACIEENNKDSSSSSNGSHQSQSQSLPIASPSSAQQPTSSKVTGGRPRRRKKPSDDEDWTLTSHQLSNLVSSRSSSRGGGRRDSGESPNAARKVTRERSSSDNPNLPAFRNPRTILSWLIDNNVVAQEAWVFCCGGKDNELVKRGKLFRSGIGCHCCDSLLTLSQFEVHAGCKGQPPSASIFLEHDTRSLLDCQNQALMMIKANNNGDNDHHHENDSICSICLKGGFILLCDRCPASFHAECIGLDHVPPGDWFCPSCSCRICNRPKCREDSSRQETHLANNFIACYQCRRRFHIGCLAASRDFAFLEMETDCNELWFCNKACEKIFLTLNSMLGKPILVGDGNLTWTLLTSLKNSNNDNDDDGYITEMESKLNVALGVIHECFEPIIDPVFGRDIAADIMFSRYSWLPRMNFTGFYTVILERNDEVISVANTRIYGQKVAEVPLVATRNQYRNQGMCRILMDQLEKLLVKLGVERLLLPAAPNLIKFWTNSFGFAKMTHSDQYYYVGYPLANFPDTTLCHKSLKQPLMLC
ncbi:increased DNA methylation 1-like [Arachis stenosperma]|uniref:increased DNA methylation 1-like n=1 Tax=Arachis stenosperma TaxID=217475 RepID=UPI0025ABB40B|nr:increased DNA methylation 1-like [Arachis stenosperma]